jgi:cytochrome P450
MVLASANRDEEMFERGEQLDITRDPCPHLSFGIGTHFCLGAQLARMEGAIALAALVRRFPDLRLSDATLTWRPAPVLRGLDALPVAF